MVIVFPASSRPSLADNPMRYVRVEHSTVEGVDEGNIVALCEKSYSYAVLGSERVRAGLAQCCDQYTVKHTWHMMHSRVRFFLNEWRVRARRVGLRAQQSAGARASQCCTTYTFERVPFTHAHANRQTHKRQSRARSSDARRQRGMRQKDLSKPESSSLPAVVASSRAQYTIHLQTRRSSVCVSAAVFAFCVVLCSRFDSSA